MILRNSTRGEAPLAESGFLDADPVDAAVLSLAEAAIASEREITVEQLQEAVAAKVEELTEAGGLISWLSRAHTGKDSTLPGKVKSEMNLIRTKADRDKHLEQVEKLIDEAKGVTAGQVLYHLAVPGLLFGTIGLIWRALNKNSASVTEYRTALHKLHGELKAMKFDKDGKRVAD